MQPESPAQKPRRERHLVRWSFIGILAILGWYGWKGYDFQQARKEAEKLGWMFYYEAPSDVIQKEWKAAFRKETWSNTTRWLEVAENTQIEHHFDVIRRLNPSQLRIRPTFPRRDLSELNGLSNLTTLLLDDCPTLDNIDALKGMKELNQLMVHNSPVLSNIDVIKELQGLELLSLTNCTGLTSVDALREMKTLKLLSLAGCKRLKTVDGILGLTELQHLSLDKCEGLTTEAWVAVKTALTKTGIKAPN